MRSGQQQLKEEFAAIYKRMTDPEEREKERLKRERTERIKDQQADYGL